MFRFDGFAAAIYNATSNALLEFLLFYCVDAGRSIAVVAFLFSKCSFDQRISRTSPIRAVVFDILLAFPSLCVTKSLIERTKRNIVIVTFYSQRRSWRGEAETRKVNEQVVAQRNKRVRGGARGSMPRKRLDSA